ncbi:MAG: helix-turn-helix domain-containing protein [Candidatus Subteraquimicrobiales bacterium]|nr:helix-turn-helix domain-containing protein [Candidatus Subteraquimicrobiales bacterium]
MKKKNNKHAELGMRIALAVWVSGKKSHEFATLLEVAPSNISRWVTGVVAPSYDYLINIAKISGLSLEWLLTGKGWAYFPSTPSQAIDWISKQLEHTVRRVLIVPYYDNLCALGLSVFGMPNGFVIESEKGNISMSGRVIRSGYAGSGQNTYIDVLSVIKSKRVRADKIFLADFEMETLDNIDLSSLLLSQNITKNIIDNELSKLRPDLYPSKEKYAVTGRLSSTSEEGEFKYATTHGIMESFQVENITGLTQAELISRFPGGPSKPLTLEEAKQIIQKRKEQLRTLEKPTHQRAEAIESNHSLANISDTDLSEILKLLKEHPEDKNLVLKLLKGKREIKEAMEGLSGLPDKK